MKNVIRVAKTGGLKNNNADLLMEEVKTFICKSALLLFIEPAADDIPIDDFP